MSGAIKRSGRRDLPLASSRTAHRVMRATNHRYTVQPPDLVIDKIGARDPTWQWQDGWPHWRAMPTADRPYHHGDLQRALIDAALAEIEGSGPAGLSLREI